MNRNQVLDALSRLLPSQFEELRFRLDVPNSYLPSASQLQRATALIKYVENKDKELKAIINALPADMRKHIQTETPAPTSTPSSHQTFNIQGDVIMSGGKNQSGVNFNGNVGNITGNVAAGSINTGTQVTAGRDIANTTIANRDVIQKLADSVNPNETVTQEQFNQDVIEILTALTDAKEELERNQFKPMRNGLEELSAIKPDLDGKNLEDALAMIEDLWLKETSETFKTSLQKLEGTKVMETILDSKTIAKLVGLALKTAL